MTITTDTPTKDLIPTHEQPSSGARMSTVAVPIQITCPDWCTVPAREHAEDLWNMGGDCIHRSDTQIVEDTVGYETALTEPRFYGPVSIRLATTTRPDGREDASPVVSVDERDYSVQQALALADTLKSVVETYRSGEWVSA